MNKWDLTPRTFDPITGNSYIDSERQSFSPSEGRNPVRLSPIPQLAQELSAASIVSLSELAGRLIEKTPFNSFHQMIQLLDAYDELSQTSGGNFKDAWEMVQLNSNTSEAETNGTNCVGLSRFLVRDLALLGLKGFVAPSISLLGYTNPDAYKILDINHTLVVVPCIIDGKQVTIALDPGYSLPHTFVFSDRRDSETFRILSRSSQVRRSHFEDTRFPYAIVLMDDDSDDVLVPFNPGYELLNPDETVIKDTFRAVVSFTITKPNSNGRREALLVQNLKDRTIKLKVGKEKAKEFDSEPFKNVYTFEQFYQNNSAISRELRLVCLALGIDVDQTTQNIHRVAERSDEYVETMLVTS